MFKEEMATVEKYHMVSVHQNSTHFSEVCIMRLIWKCHTLHHCFVELTPWQDISECNTKLEGNKQTVTLQVDEEDPVVECGFHDADGINVVEGKILYAYTGSELFARAGQKDIGDLQDAKLFYNITVS